MADPVLVPPVPVINQGDSPEQIAHTLENVQKIFDKVSPKIRGTPTPEPPTAPPVDTVKEKPAEAPVKPVETPESVEKPPAETPAEHKLPSFLEKALSTEPTESSEPIVDELEQEFPETLPVEQKQSRIKSLRDAYKTLKEKVKVLETQPRQPDDPLLNQKMQLLESRNKEMQETLTRLGVEQHTEFQNRILRPMQGAWAEAARIVKDGGGDPQDLAKALALNGKAQYEALDAIFEGMPESAKIEANEAIRSYRRLDEQRRQALAKAPETAAALKKADIERNLQAITQQKQAMSGLFDEAVAKLRDEAKLEVLQKSADTDAKWWNEQGDMLVETARSLFVDNTDMKKVAFACALAPMVDVYRTLWRQSQAQLAKEQKLIRERLGGEPNMSESGGNVRNGVTNPAEDLKQPFDKVFLREFHKARTAGAR